MPFACLPWYAFPETEGAQDALWSIVARHLRREGVGGVPEALSHGVPVPRALTEPDLLLGQCCGYDLIYGLSGSVALVATPHYAAEGCAGADYRSFVLVRESHPAVGIADLRGGVCVVNGFNSHSGANALRPLIAPLAEDGRFFGAVRVSGSHVASLAMVTSGAADAMAMDCVVHALLARHRPHALDGTRILARTEAAPAPPLVTSATADGDTIARLRNALAGAMADPAAAEAKAALLIADVAVRPLPDYARLLDFEAAALSRGYGELHATSARLART